MDSVPKMSGLFSEDVLRCPNCKEPYLHHGKVMVYDRHEDDEFVNVTTVNDGLSATHRIPSIGSGNPSSRRDGVTIEFMCENCHGGSDEGLVGVFRLTIAQHKGNTYMRWDTTSVRSLRIVSS